MGRKNNDCDEINNEHMFNMNRKIDKIDNIPMNILMFLYDEEYLSDDGIEKFVARLIREKQDSMEN